MATQIHTVCPSTHKVIFDQAETSLIEAQRIALASKNAFHAYRRVELEHKKAIVRKALDIIDSRKDELAKDITTQMGRPIRYCAAELKTTRVRAEYLMDIAEESLADLPGRAEAGFKRMVKKVPMGPILIASAWNVSTSPPTRIQTNESSIPTSQPSTP